MQISQIRSLKRALVFAVLLAIAAGYFWTQSRYPALDLKSLMGSHAATTGISFDNVWQVGPADSKWKLIIGNTMNWYYTNWKGMTFGLIFASLLLAFFLSLSTGWRPRSRAGAVLSGMIAGVPLGVCANCVTPIAKGMHASGFRPDSYLATMISSPTLNVVVVTMAFSLLPFELAIAKLAATGLLILIFVPLISAAFMPNHSLPPANAPKSQEFTKESWGNALLGAGKLLAQSTFFILRTTLPLMLLAGFLGSLVVTIVPLDTFLPMQPSVAGYLSFALLGSLLPVPMTFDIISVSVLLDRGLSIGYAATLLFTLGTFSIYPFMVLWNSISRKAASGMMISVFCLGIAAGVSTQAFEDRQTSRLLAFSSEGESPMSKEEILDSAESVCSVGEEPSRADCMRELLMQSQRAIPHLPCSVFPDENQCRIRSAAYFAWYGNNTCASIKENNARLTCESIALWKVAEDNGKSVRFYCNRTKLAASICEESGSYADALGSGDRSYCRNITDSKARFRCDWLSSHYKAIFEQDLGACLGLDREDGIEYCIRKAMVSESWNIAKSDCRPLPGNAKRYCEESKFYRSALSTANPKDCLRIETPQAQQQCLSRVGSNRIIEEERNRRIGGHWGASLALLRSQSAVNEDKASFGSGEINLPKPLDFAKLKQDGNTEISVARLGTELSGIPVFRFRKFEGPQKGIESPAAPVSDFHQPFFRGRGISSGDVNRNGWQDFVIGTPSGPALYLNTGGLNFQRAEVSASNERDQRILNSGPHLVALVDLNNDGYLDLFFSTLSHGNHVLWSNSGSFSKARLTKIPGVGGSITRTAAFYDVSGNSYPDVFLGNWFRSSSNSFSPVGENLLLTNDRGTFRKDGRYADPYAGLTLGSLFSDMNKNGKPELFIGNDLLTPDEIIWDMAKGDFQRLAKGNAFIPQMVANSMSIDSADINNDLALDLFSVDIDWTHGSEVEYCSLIEHAETRKSCLISRDLREKIWSMNASSCQSENVSIQLQADCVGTILRNVAIRRKDLSICKSVPERLGTIRAQCVAAVTTSSGVYSAKNTDLPQVNRNVLLIQDPATGKFSDLAREFGVAKSYYAWNARIHDLDGDGWQDIYVANGDAIGPEVSPNILFANQSGKSFRRETKSGLEEMLHSASYAVADFDNDGDLDIIMPTITGPVLIFENETKSTFIQIELVDDVRNSHGIGARIYIAGKGGQQLREVKASGGFASYDSTIAHFGLGSGKEIETIRIAWPDGAETIHSGPFPAGSRYRIHRKK